MKNVKDMKNQSIGIEIETIGLTNRQAALVIGEYFKTKKTLYKTNDNYNSYTVKDTKGRTWRCMSDCSLSHNKSSEITSPILYWDDIEDLKNIVIKLREAGAYVNYSCGVHVHIGAQNLDVQSLLNLVNVMYSKEDLIFKALKVSKSRANRWCKKVDTNFLTKLKENKPNSLQDFKHLWYTTQSGVIPTLWYEHYDVSRYHALNLHSYFQRGTVEFRLFDGSLDENSIEAYVKFCAAIVTYAENVTKTSAKKIDTDNDKYSFRVFMIKLGMKGKEFKTSREILMRNLEGNSAWR